METLVCWNSLEGRIIGTSGPSFENSPHFLWTLSPRIDQLMFGCKENWTWRWNYRVVVYLRDTDVSVSMLPSVTKYVRHHMAV